MEYSTIKGGIKVSRLGFGCSTLGHEFGRIDEAEGIAAVHEAIKRGVNYFDTSPFYGRGRSEEVLGLALKGIPRDSFVVSTKVGRYDLDKFDFSAERVTASIDESLARLGLEYVDIAICHDVEFGSLDQIINETIPALKRLRDLGKLKLVGVSGLPLHIFQHILARTNDVDLILSYCHYTLLDDSLNSIAPLLQEKGVTVINASPLGMGLLTASGPPAWHPAPAPVKQACVSAAEWCKAHNADISNIALSFSVRNPLVSSTLCGIPDRAQLVQNIAAVIQPPRTDDMASLLQQFQPVHNITWASGRPENNGELKLN